MFNSHFAANLLENLAVCVSEGYSVKLTIALKRRQTYMIYPPHLYQVLNQQIPVLLPVQRPKVQVQVQYQWSMYQYMNFKYKYTST